MAKAADGKPKPRGEIAELTASLQSLCTMGKRSDKELRAQKKDVFKKVINYLTVGMDMSSLFPSMMSCANLSPDDIVLKKMLYLYITHYSSQTPDLALLTINQLHKDCHDQDPTVRGLALRTLCSLRVANFLEYVTSPVLSGLEDRHPYVRRTAVLGVLKIYHIDANIVFNTAMLDKVRHLLYSDPDPQVLANCLTVMMQIDDLDKKPVDKVLLYNLINRLKDFSDWSQCQVLDLTARYKPTSEAEVYDLLNVLEDRMQHNNSAVVMAAVKVFLHLTLDMPATHQQVLERIKDPLRSLLGRDDPATVYAVLSHALLVVQRAPVIFEQDYTSFYCRTHDPWYVKRQKMEVLSLIATATNVYDIVNELSEYARDIAPAMAREAVAAVGRIALAVPDVSGIIERLLMFLETGSDHIVAETLIQMKDLLRRYPDMAEVCLAQMGDLAPAAVSEPDARAALVWILGQFGQHIQDAPYLLEPLAENYAQEDERVRAALLTAAAQLFFKRPPECRALLGGLLAAGLADPNQDVHDRALLYYRLLRTNVGEAERIINPPLLAVSAFSESVNPEVKEAVFREFNSLSVIFQAPESTFVERRGYHSLEAEEEEEGQQGPGQGPAAPAAAAAAGGAASDDLLLIDNATTLLGGSSNGAGSGSADADLLDGGALGGPSSISGAVAGAPGSAGGGRMVSSSGTGGLGLELLDVLGAPAPAAAPSALQPSGFATAAPTASTNPLDLSDLSNLLMGGGPAAISTFPAAAAPQPAAAVAAPGFAQPTWGGAASSSISGVAPATGSSSALLDLDDVFGGLGAPAPQPAAPAQPQQQPELRLSPQARISPAAFQAEWKTLPVAHTSTDTLSPATIAAMSANGHKDFCSHMTQAYIHTMASGGQAPTFKYYFYGQAQPGGQLLLVEFIVRTDSRLATVTVKSAARELLPQFVELWSNCLMGFYR